MEIDVFGSPAPSCRFAGGRIRAAVAQLPEHTWGRIDDWKCVWELTAAFCKHDRVSLYASNPGD
jgi:hypothetical protein